MITTKKDFCYRNAGIPLPPGMTSTGLPGSLWAGPGPQGGQQGAQGAKLDQCPSQALTLPLPEPGVNFSLNSGPGMNVREAAFLCFMEKEGEFRRRKWQPTPVFLPGESHGQRSLAGHSP